MDAILRIASFTIAKIQIKATLTGSPYRVNETLGLKIAIFQSQKVIFQFNILAKKLIGCPINYDRKSVRSLRFQM